MQSEYRRPTLDYTCIINSEYSYLDYDLKNNTEDFLLLENYNVKEFIFEVRGARYVDLLLLT